jgi:hypothetical protein
VKSFFPREHNNKHSLLAATGKSVFSSFETKIALNGPAKNLLLLSAYKICLVGSDSGVDLEILLQ